MKAILIAATLLAGSVLTASRCGAAPDPRLPPVDYSNRLPAPPPNHGSPPAPQPARGCIEIDASQHHIRGTLRVPF